MKNFKRILALVMVFCTVAAWMIPGVSASDYDVTFDLRNVTAGRWLAYDSEQQVLKDQEAGYDNGTEGYNWKFYRTADGSIVKTARNAYNHIEFTAGRGLYLNCVTDKTGGDYAYTALEFKAPAQKGYYTLDLSFCWKANLAAAGAYIIEIPEENYADFAAMPKYDSDKALALNNVDVSKIGGNATNVAYAGTNVVELDPNNRYAIVFYLQNTGSNAYVWANEFSLKYVPAYDYSVTYNANYEGADPATVADTATATAVTKDFTVQEVPFDRGSSYAIEGWATAPDGDVVYKTGDTITLTSEDPSIELYAVWKEVWDPANNTDLTVNFKNDFTAAGVASGAYLAVSATSADLLDAAYTAGTIKWTTIRTTQTGTVGYNATSNGGRYRGGFLEVQHGSQQTYYPYAGVPLRFKAPGTGEYRLSFTYGKASAAENGGTLIGAYIKDMPEAGTLTRYTNFTPSGSLVSATVENPGASGSGVSEGTVVLEGGKEYMIAFFAYDSTGAKAVANFVDFTLTEVKPEASIGSTNYATVEDAVADAVSGNTIKLGMDADVAELNPVAGVVIDLNGKTLTVSGAVAATVTDSNDGNGRLAVAKESAVVTAAAGQVALWDNTTDASGYRVFNYTFSNYGNGIYENTNKAVTAVDKTYKMFDSEANGAYVQATMSSYFDAYATKGWRFEATTATYNLLKNQWHWGTSYGYAMNSSGTPTSAFRFLAPGTGEMTFTLDYNKHTRGTSDADIYIIPATAIDNAIADAHSITAAAAGEVIADAISANSTNVGSWDEANATAASYMSTINTAIATAIANETPVIDGMSFNGDGRDTVKGTYDFGDEPVTEYLLVIKANAAVSGYGSSYIWDFSFTRAAKEATMAQSIWSVLQFTNSNAYALIASGENALSVGFDMAWNGVGKTFAFTDDQVLAWAEQELADDQTYGFYIRIEGFEKVGAGTLTGTPYISFGGNKITADTVTYNYTAE